MMRSRKCRKGGFTLIEVLLVMAILVILAGFAVGTYQGVKARTDRSAAKAQVLLLKSTIETYQATVDSYPSSLQALRTCPQDLPDPTKWAGPYLDADVPLDPWGNPYQYACPGQHNPDSFDVWSYGPDRVNGTPDDIGNWSQEGRR
jgi:general secretion pathway protein G